MTGEKFIHSFIHYNLEIVAQGNMEAREQAEFIIVLYRLKPAHVIRWVIILNTAINETYIYHLFSLKPLTLFNKNW